MALERGDVEKLAHLARLGLDDAQSECRHHAQLSRLPCLRAGVPDALAGERQSGQTR